MQVLARLAASPRGVVAMGHAWFGAQLLWRMNATLRHVGNIGVDFHLGRAWADFDCLGMAPRCAGTRCIASDLKAAPWQPPVVKAAVTRWTRPLALLDDPMLNRSLPPPITLPEPR
jgi:hypothetical protein